MYTVYAKDNKDIDYVTKGLSLEEAQNWYHDVTSTFYNKAGVTWDNGVAFFENEDEDQWRFEGFDGDGIPFYGGYYKE